MNKLKLLTINDVNLKNKNVLLRLDLNAPINEKKQIISDARITAVIPTIKNILKQKPKNIIIMSHLGQPKEEKYNKKFSLLPILNSLKKKLNCNILLIKEYLFDNNWLISNEKKIFLLENVRFNKGETKNEINLSKKYASFCDVFVIDAFATLHRKHSSTYGICKFAKIVCVGPLILSELKNINLALKNPLKPMISIIGGAKISTKFNVLNSLIKISDFVVIAGAMANTFIAVNYKVGKSFYEPDFINEAKNMLDTSKVIIPQDCVVSEKFSMTSQTKNKDIDKIENNEIIMDIGIKTINKINSLIEQSNTILWNGPLGVYEFPQFRYGTEMIAKCISKNKKAFSLVGGGDTLAIIDYLNIKNDISYISTGGGAFLEMISKKKLPVIEMIQKKYNKII